jgi:DNA-binding transcriptional regulator WhiA
VASSARQIALIEQLETEGRLGQLSAVDQTVARARKDAPEASFTELAGTLGLSRARVQRAFGRIEAAAGNGTPAAD